MAKTSTLGSPGVEVIEIDNSVRIVSSTSDTAYIVGYAAQGPVEEVNNIGSLDDFVQIYGEPTNAAERYFYYTVKALLEGTGGGTRVLTSRLPYGKGAGDRVSTAYTVLAYPAIPVVKNKDNEIGVDSYKLTLTPTEDITVAEKCYVTLVDGYELVFGEEEASDSIAVKFTGDKDTCGKAKFSGLTIKEQGSETATAISCSGVGAYVVDAEKKTLSAKLAIIGKEKDEDKEFGFVSLTIESASAPTTPLSFTVTKTVCVAYKKFDSFKGYEKKGNKEINYEDVTYVIGAPVVYQLSLSEYARLVSGEAFKWNDSASGFDATYGTIGHSAFIVINTARTTINDRFEGFYLGITDNMFVTPSDLYYYNAVTGVKVTTKTVKDKEPTEGKMESLAGLEDTENGDFDSLTRGRMGFEVDGNGQGSISRILSRSIVNKDISSSEYDDTLSFGLFNLVNGSTQSVAANKLSYSLRERFNASLGRTRTKTTVTSPVQVSYFVENVINPGETSNNIQVMVNPNIYDSIKLDPIDNTLHGKTRVFGEKLVENMKMFQRLYLTKRSGINNSFGETVAAETAKRVYEMLSNDESNYIALVRQAGVTTSVLASLTLNPLNNLYGIGTYTTTSNTSKIIGNLPYKLERALQLVESDEEYPDMDLIVDGGLTTIYPYSSGNNAVLGDQTGLIEDIKDSATVEDDSESKQTRFVDTVTLEGIEDMRTGKATLNEYASSVKQDFLAVENTFLKFCNAQTNGGRGDSFFVGDILRGILVKGKNTKVCNIFGTQLTSNVYSANENVNHSWTTSIYSAIKHLTDSTVSSYASLYAQWFMVDDVFSGKKVWIPASGFVAALMGATDQAQGPWYAAAGLNRGVITGPIDIAISPNQSQRTDLYKLCINSIPKMPNGGITVWGIRTMSKVDSAFDQNTCRRTFLYMEKRLKQYLRYFLFEPNTSFTRLNIYNDIDPFLAGVQAAGGIYSYSIVCDESNNTPDIINNGDLAVDVAAAPTRTAENIILTMTVNKYTGGVSGTSSL